MRVRTLLLLAAVLLLLAGGVWLSRRESAYPIINAHPGGTAVVAFGDSLTFGTGAAPDESYPAVLSRRLGVPILNRGVPGSTSADAVSRVDGVLADDPRIVLLCLGGNDLLRRVPVAETMSNLEAIVKRLQAHGALVILIGLDPPMGNGFPAALRDLARRKGCPCVPDALAGIFNQRDLMADYVHPNAKGYAKMADHVEPVLRPYLARRE